MKKNWIIVLLTTACWSCHAQSLKIQKAFAFYTVSIPGRAMSDANGNTINPKPIIERCIYIETNYKNKPKVDAVLYNGILFNYTIDSIAEKKLAVGINAVTGEPVVMNPKKGNRLWRISLQQSAGETISPEQIKTIVLKCKLGKTSVRQVLPSEVQLSTPDRY